MLPPLPSIPACGNARKKAARHAPLMQSEKMPRRGKISTARKGVAPRGESFNALFPSLELTNSLLPDRNAPTGKPLPSAVPAGRPAFPAFSGSLTAPLLRPAELRTTGQMQFREISTDDSVPFLIFFFLTGQYSGRAARFSPKALWDALFSEKSSPLLLAFLPQRV